MKDKKLKLFILLCIIVIIGNFIIIWNFEELFFKGLWYVIFISFILLLICMMRSFICLKNIRICWFAAIPVLLFGIYLIFLFSDGMKKLNFQVYKEKRIEIVQMAKKHQIDIEKNSGIIELPEYYHKCSSGGKAIVWQNNDDYVVGFWYTQGFLNSSFSMFVYSSDDNPADVVQMMKEYMEMEYKIDLPEKEKCWYYVVAKNYE